MDLLQQSEIIFKKESFDIIGACMEVYNILGCGFSESVYQEALEIEFGLQKIPFLSQFPLEITYKSKILKKKFVPDFICYDKIIVEIKAVDVLVDNHISQVLNYLKTTGFQLGLLVNFGAGSLQYKRIVK
jgi:GxxExxY protein